MRPFKQVWAYLKQIQYWLQSWVRWRQLGSLALGISLVLWLSGTTGVWSQTRQLQVVVQGQDYAQMVEASRPLVWQALTQGFSQGADPAQRVEVEVMGRQGSAQMPLLLVTLDRQDWQSGPTPNQMEQYAQFYTSAIALLHLPTPDLSAAAQATPPPSTSPSQGLALIESQPSHRQQLVPVDQTLSLRFNQALPPDLEELEISISPAAELAFDVQGDRLVLQPLSPLGYSTTYQLALGTLASQTLVEPVTLEFRTEPQYTYERDVRSLLQASCVGCHQPYGRQRRQRLDTYETVMAYVRPQDAGSPLLNPRWTQRHARPRRIPPPEPGVLPEVSDLSTFFNPTTNLDAAASAEATTVDEAKSPEQLLASQSEVAEFTGSPEIAYARRLGVSLDQLGQWDAEEVEVVRTWIVQDGAPETLESAIID